MPLRRPKEPVSLWVRGADVLGLERKVGYVGGYLYRLCGDRGELERNRNLLKLIL